MVSLTFSLTDDFLDPPPSPLQPPPSVLPRSQDLMATPALVGVNVKALFKKKSEDGASGIGGSRCSVNMIRTLGFCFSLGEFHSQADCFFSRGPSAFKLKVN